MRLLLATTANTGHFAGAEAGPGHGLVLAAAALAAVAVLVHAGVGPPRRLASLSAGAPFGPGVPDAARAGWRGRLARLADRLRRRRELDIVALLSALAAELEAGQPTTAALEAACRTLPGEPCGQSRAAARLGGDVPAALRADARAQDCSGLRLLAACWEVAGSSGAGLALSVRRLAEAERAARLARADLVGELAAVRASAQLLAGLPLLGLALGIAMGASPLAWLLGSTMGRGALLAGLALQGLGLLWLQRIVRRARRGIP